MCTLHVDESQENSQYDMIIGRYLLSELQIYIYFSVYTIRLNVGSYLGCTDSMIDTNNSYVKIPPTSLMTQALGMKNYGKLNMYSMLRDARTGSWTQNIKNPV